MTEFFTFVIAAFATYRLARMITRESGAFDLFINLRTFVFNRFGNGWVNEGINCFHCVAFWIALLIVALLLPLAMIPLNVWFILWWFGVAGAASFLWEIESK